MKRLIWSVWGGKNILDNFTYFFFKKNYNEKIEVSLYISKELILPDTFSVGKIYKLSHVQFLKINFYIA